MRKNEEADWHLESIEKELKFRKGKSSSEILQLFNVWNLGLVFRFSVSCSVHVVQYWLYTFYYLNIKT